MHKVTFKLDGKQVDRTVEVKAGRLAVLKDVSF
jgi:hypothetical protein